MFRRDMFLDIPIIADLIDVQERRQIRIDENLRRQNQKRREYHYTVGQEVLIKAVNPGKLEARAHGPYIITATNTNGTVDVQLNPHVMERINIRRIIPYKR